MAINIDCPRCKMPLSVPGKKAGTYANCPHCKGRLWVPKDAPDAASGGRAAAPPTQPPPPQPPTQPRTPQAPSTQAASPQTPSTQAASPPGSPPRAGRKVARFISAEAAQSTLKPADDGRLPELHLQESEQKKQPEHKSTSINPLVLAGALSLSVVLSISLVLVGSNSSRSSNVRKQTRARQVIEEQFFGEIGSPEPLEEYQVLLREAQRGHSRKDYKAERRLYRKVLQMLRAERGEHEGGVTGSAKRDEELKNQISILLSDQ